jgi:urease accessory protein
MRTASTVEVAPGGVLRRLDVAPPLTIRQVHGERGECALCLVGTAAGPLAGDDLSLLVDLDAGAHASLRATGAAIAQGRAGSRPATVATTVRLGAGARLSADPGALVVCAGAAVDVRLAIELAAGAALEWHELVVLGRTGEPAAGAVRLGWDVRRSGVPLLRQDIDLAHPDLRGWSGMTGGHRVLATSLLVGPEVAAATVVHGPYAVAQPLADDAVLVTVLADGAADAVSRRAALSRDQRSARSPLRAG